LECLESSQPFSVVIDVVHIVLECFKLPDLLLYTISDRVDWFRRARYSFKVVAEDSEKLLKDNARNIKVFKNDFHVSGSIENFLDLRKVPSLDCDFTFDLHFCVLELLLPSVKDLNALFYYNYGVMGLLFENFCKLNLVADLLTNFIRYGLQDVFKLLLILVDMTRNGPNQL